MHLNSRNNISKKYPFMLKMWEKWVNIFTEFQSSTIFTKQFHLLTCVEITFLMGNTIGQKYITCLEFWNYIGIGNKNVYHSVLNITWNIACASFPPSDFSFSLGTVVSSTPDVMDRRTCNICSLKKTTF